MFLVFQHSFFFIFFFVKKSRQIVTVDKVRQTHDFFLICLLDCVGFHMCYIVVFSPSVIFQIFLPKNHAFLFEVLFFLNLNPFWLHAYKVHKMSHVSEFPVWRYYRLQNSFSLLHIIKVFLQCYQLFTDKKGQKCQFLPKIGKFIVPQN